jgi:hypothetical protein
LFRADQLVTAVPFQTTLAQAFAKRFELRQLMYQPGDARQNQPGIWNAKKGVAAMGPERRIVVDEVSGNEHHLSVTVEGDSADAIDLLQEIWAALSEISGAEVSDVTSLGTLTFATRTVTEFPFLFPQLAPVLNILQDFSARAAGSRSPTDGLSTCRISVGFEARIGTAEALQEIVLEPRSSAELKDKIYFVASPLRTDDHMAMLSAICDCATSSK